MFLIHNALGEDAKMFDADEKPTPSGLFTKISQNPEDNEELSVSTLIRNDYNEVLNKHPEIIDKMVSEDWVIELMPAEAKSNLLPSACINTQSAFVEPLSTINFIP